MLCACDLLFDDQDLARLRNYALAEGVDAGNTRALVAAILLDSAGGRRAAGSFAAVAAADEAAYDMSKESMAAVIGFLYLSVSMYIYTYIYLYIYIYPSIYISIYI